jgi:hypothetical protein
MQRKDDTKPRQLVYIVCGEWFNPKANIWQMYADAFKEARDADLFAYAQIQMPTVYRNVTVTLSCVN